MAFASSAISRTASLGTVSTVVAAERRDVKLPVIGGPTK
jgi:hypothetical protein